MIWFRHVYDKRDFEVHMKKYVNYMLVTSVEVIDATDANVDRLPIAFLI